MVWPKITVVTPSYNQGQYLEQTILSVIGQHYPNLEYIIMDGGSTDNSVDIIRKYEQHIAYWESKPDSGQANAINKGFRLSTGGILCWLNSDDMYFPGVLFYVAERFMKNQTPSILFGNCMRFNETNTEAVRGSNVEARHASHDITLVDYIIQPSCFWNRMAWMKVGELNEEFNFVFDWEWFIRASKSGVELLPDRKFLSLYRIHSQHKTGTGGEKRLREIEKIYKTFNSTQEAAAFIRYGNLRGIVRKIPLATKILSWHDLIYIIFFSRTISRKQYRSISIVR
jgi:glycosyltransferase involved in cell wall biosynthesis